MASLASIPEQHGTTRSDFKHKLLLKTLKTLMGLTLRSAAQREKVSQRLAALWWTEISEALVVHVACRPRRRLNLLYMTVAEKTWIWTQETLECRSLPSNFSMGKAQRGWAPIPGVTHTLQWVKANQLLSVLPHHLPFEVCFEKAFRSLVSVDFSLLSNKDTRKRSLTHTDTRLL